MSQAQIGRTHPSERVSGPRKRVDVKSWPGPIGGARAAVRIIRRATMVQAYEVALMASVAGSPSRVDVKSWPGPIGVPGRRSG